MPHEDGPAYHPIVATVSLGADIVLDVYPKKRQKKDDDKFRILQERRSLLVTRKAMYTDFLHGIAEVEEDHELDPEGICNWDMLGEDRTPTYHRETRISLTYREVRNVVTAIKFLSR